MLSIVTCSVGVRLKALYDDSAQPTPECLESLLRALEQRQSNPAAKNNPPDSGDGPCSSPAHRRRS